MATTSLPRSAQGAPRSDQPSRLPAIAVTLLAIVLAVALLASNPHLLVALSTDKEGQALLPVGTLAPGSSTTGSLTLANEGLLPLRYSLNVKPGLEEMNGHVVIRLRRNSQSFYFYQGLLTSSPIPIGSLYPGQHDDIELTLSAPPNATSKASIPVDDTFVWSARSPGIEFWWWLLVVALLLAVLSFLMPRLLALIVRLRRLAPAPFELVWRVPLILAILLIASLVPLTGVSLANVNAQSANPGNEFAIGGLVLTDRSPSGTTCLSVTGAAAQSTTAGHCDSIFTVLQGRPGTRGSGRVIIRNAGTVPVGKLALWSGACRTIDVPNEKAHGTGELCDKVVMTVHDDNHDYCYFPVSAPGACPDRSSGADASLAAFAARYNGQNRLSVNPDGVGSGIIYDFVVALDPSARNDVQGRTPVIDFFWEVSQ